jgi:hypothetical protein
MLRNLFSAFLLFILSNALAQTEKEIYKTTVGQFKQQYNQSKYEEIFNRFSPEMKKALPLDKTIDFLKGFLKKLAK